MKNTPITSIYLLLNFKDKRSPGPDKINNETLSTQLSAADLQSWNKANDTIFRFITRIIETTTILEMQNATELHTLSYRIDTKCVIHKCKYNKMLMHLMNAKLDDTVLATKPL